MNEVSGKPVEPVDRDAAETRAKAQLRQAVWEATQFMTYGDLREYVEGVFAEIVSDEL